MWQGLHPDRFFLNDRKHSVWVPASNFCLNIVLNDTCMNKFKKRNKPYSQDATNLEIILLGVGVNMFANMTAQ